MRQKPNLQRGFTLVEILVVVSIVAVLAALLIPAFASVRESGRRASCASNLSQISKAMSLYLSDHNDRYPPVRSTPGCTWVDAVYPYVKSTAVFSCPSANFGEYVPGCGPGKTLSLGNFDGFNGSYDLVSPFVESQTTSVPNGHTTAYKVEPKTLAASRYRFPSSTILVLDGSDTSYLFHFKFAVVNPGVDPIHDVADLKDGGVLARHRDGVNLLYVDGHVKWQKLESLTSTPMWRYDGQEPVATPTPVPSG